MFESGAARGETATLGQLVRALTEAGLAAGDAEKALAGLSPDIVIDHLASDSRAVGPNGLFVAIRGAQTDGHMFIDKAVNNGAIAIVYEATPAESHHILPGVALVPVNDTHRALGILAASYFANPSTEVDVVGVTGTNGKTTTAWLIYQAMTELNPPAGLVGTIEYRTPRGHMVASHTTPDALAVQALLARIRDEGGRSCAMEVSSHALVQRRVECVGMRVGVFTNLTQDHLDYHGDMRAYLAAKKILFDALDPSASAVYNVDDDSGSAIVADTVATRLSYGMTQDADIRFGVLENLISGLSLNIDGVRKRFGLVGRFNAYNVVAAYAAARALGHGASETLDALENALAAPGRFERIDLAGGPVAIVDYAHTPDALENVLATIAELGVAGETWCVFGCGGDRDRAKRPIMGRIAEAGADHVVVTDDNPRTESSEQIFDDIRPGLSYPDRASWIADRARAIEHALRAARANDVVLVAGKGHETYQVKGTRRLDFDDRDEIRRTWKQLRRTRDTDTRTNTDFQNGKPV